MNLLRKIGACEFAQPKLTPLGQHLAALPVNVKIGKMLIFGAIFGCLDAVVRTLGMSFTFYSPFKLLLKKIEKLGGNQYGYHYRHHVGPHFTSSCMKQSATLISCFDLFLDLFQLKHFPHLLIRLGQS